APGGICQPRTVFESFCRVRIVIRPLQLGLTTLLDETGNNRPEQSNPLRHLHPPFAPGYRWSLDLDTSVGSHAMTLAPARWWTGSDYHIIILQWGDSP